MSGVLIVKPLPIAATPTVAGSGADNLRTEDPNEAWIAPSTASLTMDIDMGAAVTVDSFYLGYTNAAAAAAWTIASGTGLGTGLTVIKASGPMRAADSEGPRHHVFARIADPVTARYFRLTLAQAGASPLYVGALVVGLAFEKHREFGNGRTAVDVGARQDLPGGGFGIGDGVVKSQFAFSFIDLSETERNRLWSIEKDRGIRRPVVLVEDNDLTSGMNDAIHYGVFDRLQPFERANAREYKHAGMVIDWA
ncbi:hypothetical protein HHL26_04570 [Sphingobium sp. TB-6]|uniref:hypothetical protein n=1 Tax=Sphingobium sp. TB-6 TaxID=2728850 RepID=UPI001469ED42|nr:hypothetical protein [Sphingobium sp. TB-6]NML88339.1 hypothetical protein [Sphingobium sp. TB-6]